MLDSLVLGVDYGGKPEVQLDTVGFRSVIICPFAFKMPRTNWQKITAENSLSRASNYWG